MYLLMKQINGWKVKSGLVIWWEKSTGNIVGILLADKKGHVPLFNLEKSIFLNIRVPAPLNN